MKHNERTTTEGIKYAGSKRAIIPVILRILTALPVHRVLDGFSGTTRVSQALKRAGFVVHANDQAVWSHVFGDCYLLNRKPERHYRGLIDHLNRLPGKRGWFTEHYGGKANAGSSVQSDGKKRMWQEHNTMKLDAVRDEIEMVSDDPLERSVLLTSLMLAMDRVDNSLGHHASYLKEWAPRSYGTATLMVPQFTIDDLPHEVTQRDIFSIADDTDVDLAYYDPPYGSSNQRMPPSRVRYASYYHLWKTICLNDRPAVGGAANRRVDASDTQEPNVFEEFRKDGCGEYIALKALESLLARTKAPFILLSYSSGGRASYDGVVGIIRRLGYSHMVVELDHPEHVMAAMTWTGEWLNEKPPAYKGHREYLFLMGKNGFSSGLVCDGPPAGMAVAPYTAG